MNAKKCAHSTLYVSRLFAPYLTLKKKNTDAIISDSLSRHLGTPKSSDAATSLAHIVPDPMCYVTNQLTKVGESAQFLQEFEPFSSQK